MMARFATDAGRHAFQFLTITMLLVVISASSFAHAAPANEMGAIALTADTEGHLTRCATCPRQTGLGDMTRRATAIAKLRQDHPAMLLVDAGNALIGPDTLASDGKATVAAYSAMGYDALNLSYRDLRLGKDKTLAALKQAKFDAISANLADEGTGQLLLKPYIVKKLGDLRIAILGVSTLPGGAADVPHLKQQLAGIRVLNAADAIAQWLPNAKAEADRVVLLYYGDAAPLGQIRQRFGKDMAAILVGGIRPADLPAGAPLLVGAGEYGVEVAVLPIAKDGQAGSVASVTVDRTFEPDPQMTAVVDQYQKPRAWTAAPAADAAATAMQIGKSYPLGRRTQNRAARLTVRQYGLEPSYDKVQASAGRALLVIQMEWENIIPLTVIQERNVPTEYRIPQMADHLYVVINGRELARLVIPASETPGHIPLTNFRLPKIGDKIGGAAVFDVPADGLENLELRFYDYAHGNMAMPLAVRTSDTATAEAQPVSPLRKNAVLEAGVYQLSRTAQCAGKQAPAGMTFITVDLRARSLTTIQAEADQLDPRTAKGAKLKVGTVADWTESRKYLHLIVDGQYSYDPLPASTLAEAPRFLPDLMTGGQVVFLCPAITASLELRCDFPNSTAQDEAAKRPAGLTFALEGTRPALPRLQPVASAKDQIFQVAVTAQNVVEDFAGSKPQDGRKLLALDVSVANSTKGGEFFQVRQQLKYVTAKGEQLEMDPSTAQGPYPAGDVLWIPGGERRSFQIVYAIPADDRQPRLAYAAVSQGDSATIDLKAFADATPPVAAPGATLSLPASVPPPTATTRADKPPVTQKPAERPTPAPKPARPAVPELPRVTARQPNEPKGLAGVGLTPEQVNAAIDRGADYLWKYLKTNTFDRREKLGDARWHGIVCMALVHAGFHKKNPDFDTRLRNICHPWSSRTRAPTRPASSAC